MQWFREIDIDLPNRHARCPSPLCYNGILIHAGLNEIIAVDAHNGSELWRYRIQNLLGFFFGRNGVTAAGSMYCIGDGNLFIRTGNECLCLDLETGQRTKTFTLPGDENEAWGHLAYCNGRLYGSSVDMSFRLASESTRLFALDTETGEFLWEYQAEHSLRHNAIAITKDIVYLIDRPIAKMDFMKDPKDGTHPPGKLVAIDAATGKRKWTSAEDIHGTVLAASEPYDALLVCYTEVYRKLNSDMGDEMAVYSKKDGRLHWKAKFYAHYPGNVNKLNATRPVISDRTIYRAIRSNKAGGAWDLLTGKKIVETLPRSYGCGSMTCSRHMLFFRSGVLGYYDLARLQEGVQNFGGFRPGCFINTISAGGLVLTPESDTGCTCGYLMRSWVVLKPSS